MYKKLSLLLLIFSLFFFIFVVRTISAEIVSSEDNNFNTTTSSYEENNDNRDSTAVLDVDSIIQDLDKIVDDLSRSVRTGPPPSPEWLFMVYMDGDNDLEGAAIDDFLEMAQVGSDGDINIVVQFDRIGAYDSSYDDWTGCARFKIDSGDTPVLANADFDWSEGEYDREVDMGDPQTLVDFVNWAVTNYSASNYALVLWNHGGGWRERMEELQEELRTRGETLSLMEEEKILNEISGLKQILQEEEGILKAVCWDDTSGSVLYTKEVREALATLYGLEIDLNLIGFDACLMGMLEVAHEIEDYGNVMVASEKTEPLDGWPYNTILSDLVDTPSMTSSQLGTTIVNKYEEFYDDHTLSAILLNGEVSIRQNEIANLSNAVSSFAQTVLDEDDDWDVIFSAQQQAGYYTYTYYRDLKGFMEYVANNATNENIATAAQNVITVFDQCVIENYSSIADKGNGLSIYFPDWYWDDVDPDYNETNISFAETQWDEFLSAFVDAYLVPGHTGEATYTRNVTGGTTASYYIIVSPPITPSSLDPLANLQDDLGDYDETMWRFFRWNPRLNPADYEEYPFVGDDVIPGKGYWLISGSTVDIDVTGSLEGTNAPYFIILYPGWNQIGTPFNFYIDWDTVQVSTRANGSANIYYVTSLGNLLTYRTLWKYEDGGYSASAVMEPGRGYWIKNLTAGNIYLIVNPVHSTLSNNGYIASLERTLTVFARLEEIPPSPPVGMEPEPIDEEGDNGGSGSSQCFIATACFGSSLALEVEVLRIFREKYLLSNPIGKVFVSLYYRYSPPIARFIGNHKFLKVMVRSTLYPVVKSCKLTIED